MLIGKVNFLPLTGRERVVRVVITYVLSNLRDDIRYFLKNAHCSCHLYKGLYRSVKFNYLTI